jgi:AraC-like DNA-binding protein
MATSLVECRSPAIPASEGRQTAVPDVRTWSTRGVAPAEQFGYWREVICEAFTALDPSSPSPARFESRVVQTDLGGTLMSDSHSCAQSILRGRREISRAPTSGFFLNYQLSGTCRVSQGPREVLVQPGQFYLVDTARPYRQDYSDWHVLCFYIPRERLLPQLRGRGTCTAIPMRDTDGGLGTIAGTYMRSLQGCTRRLKGESRAPLAAGLAEVIGAAFADQSLEEESPRVGIMAALGQTIRDFALQRAVDPDLSAPAVAARFRISTRTLHRLFESQQTSFAQLVLEERLRRAAVDLIDPVHRLAIGDIALRCGFGDLSNFCRAFRQRFGVSASAYRQAAAGRKVSPGTV